MKRLKEMGYTIADACSCIGFARSSYYRNRMSGNGGERKKRRVPKDERQLVSKIKELKTLHPFWGYRRIRAWLVHREGMAVNIKRVRRIMKEHGLQVTRKLYKAKRRPQRSKPRAHRPAQFWGIDMTKFWVDGTGWVYLVIILDWFSKKVVGWNLSLRSKTVDWLKALDAAVLAEFPHGSRGQGLHLISDNGCQPTAESFLKALNVLWIHQILTSFNNPKGNADTERFMRTIKEELIWLNEFRSFEEAKKAIEQWIRWYNAKYPHSSLGYLSPEEFERRHNAQHVAIAA